MLRSFRVTNHRSLRDEQELVLLPSYDKSRKVRPVAAIYGANAAGKSNVLDALEFLQRVVRDSYRTWEPGTGTPRTPFRLDTSSAVEPSVYVVDLVLDSVRYVYGVALDDEAVCEEWLYRYPRGRKQVVFERDGERVKLGSTVPDYRSRQDVLSRLTRDNASALGTAAMADFDEAEPVYKWFRRALRVQMHPGSHALMPPAVIRRLMREDANKDRVVDLLRAADLGITDLRIDEMPYENPNADLEHQRIAAMRNALAHATEESKEQLTREINFLDRRVSSRPDVRIELRFLHGDDHVPLAVQEQSAGTLAWLSLVTAALDALDQGGVLCVDEIDASLHPRLTSRLVGLFKDGESNPQSAQLIFTTHDASLLGTALGEEVLARDEVWFVEKDMRGATSLFALTDFRPRQGENTERRYLGGSYGAVPLISDDDLRRAVGLDAEVA
jgi:predicted ATPase